MDRLTQAVIVLLGVPAVLVGYIYLVEWALKFLPDKQQPRIRPWLWIGPALALLTFYLVYPTLNTLYLSLLNGKSTAFVGLANYVYALTNGDMLLAIHNNVLWLIWKFMYDYRPPGQPQTGTLNAIVSVFGVKPQPWLIQQPSNNGALIFVGVWMMTGFAMVILSAGLKGLSDEVLEAARVDGANEWSLFWQIKVPMLSSTIAVVATTVVIAALKTFDIVYVMTNGNFGTDVIGRAMYDQLFNVRDYGRASAIAVILLLAIVPIMIINIRRFREQEAQR